MTNSKTNEESLFVFFKDEVKEGGNTPLIANLSKIYGK